jgi:hypothetical protein
MTHTDRIYPREIGYSGRDAAAGARHDYRHSENMADTARTHFDRAKSMLGARTGGRRPQVLSRRFVASVAA